MTPWKEEQGETFGSAALQPAMEGVGSFFRTLGTPFAAPFLRMQMNPEEEAQFGKEWNENKWSAVFGGESQMAKKYEDMPWWAKVLAEAPSMIVGGGLASAGIKGIAGAGLGRLATQTGIKGAAARIGSAALTPFGGPAKQVFQQAGKAGGLSGRAAQVMSAPMAGMEAVTGLVGKGLGKLITPTQRLMLQKLEVSSALTESQQLGVAKVTTLINRAFTKVRETTALRHTELSKRVARLAKIQEKTFGEESLTKGRSALSGELPSAKASRGFESIAKDVTEFERNDLFEALKNTKWDAPKEYYPLMIKNAQDGLQDIFAGYIPQRNQLILLEKAFGKGFAKSVLDHRSMGTKAFELAVDIANLPRALLASGDLSGLLRQGGILTMRDPIATIQSIKPMLKAALSDKNAYLLDAELRANKDIAENLLFGRSLEITSTSAGGTVSQDIFRTSSEEAFRSSLAEKLPFGIGAIIKASNRAYSTVLNQIRGRSYIKLLKSARQMGLKDESVVRLELKNQGLRGDALEARFAEMVKAKQVLTNNDKIKLGEFIMMASGRAPLPSNLEGAAGFLGTVLFSPRLLLAHAMLPKALFSSSPLVRKEAARTLVTFFGGVSSILAMAKMSGAADVELDLTSADFGKLKIGNTRLDIWTGYQQFIRFAATLATEHRKTQAGGKVEANRYDTAVRFLESKYSPALGLLKDILKGETFMGEEMSAESGFLAEQAFQRMAPLALQDIIDAMEQEGPMGGVIASPAFLGIGVMSYAPPTDEQLYEAEKQMAYFNIESEIWNQIPGGREIEKKSEELKKKDPMAARRFLAQYPLIVMTMKRIEIEKRRWVLQNKRRFPSLGTVLN